MRAVIALSSEEATLDSVGGKGWNLSRLSRAGFPVPPAFLITTEAYQIFVSRHDLQSRIASIARGAVPTEPRSLDAASAEIRALFEAGEMPGEVAEAIRSAYRSLAEPEVPADGRGEEPASLPVAVRSSATAEDLPGLSFAGQQDTFLNVIGEPELLEAAKKCWASLWTARAMGYRARNQISPDGVELAVVVQQMVAAESSGVLFTANPLTGRRDETVIDASFGLGEAVVSGQVDPDHYVVRPGERAIVSRKLGAKARAIVPVAGGGTKAIGAAAGDRQALPDEQILELSAMASRVAAAFRGGRRTSSGRGRTADCTFCRRVRSPPSTRCRTSTGRRCCDRAASWLPRAGSGRPTTSSFCRSRP